MDKVVIIGGGIIGCFLARDLSAYDLDVCVIERRNDVAREVSAANSAIVHAGYDPKDGTLKALLNKRGADRYPQICEELKVDYKRCGAYVLACGKEEESILDLLYQRGCKRNVRMQYVTREEIQKEEVHISPLVTKGLYVPDTAIITPWEVCIALMEEAMINGCQLYRNEEVKMIRKKDIGYQVMTDKDIHEADIIINAAGLGSAKIMNMVEDTPLFSITPKRGQYFVLSKHASGFVKHVMYPVPNAMGKGILALPTIHGNILLGPDNETIKEDDTSTTKQGLQRVKEGIRKTMQNIPYQEVIQTYSGLRPAGNEGDFYIQASSKDPHIIHLGCIDSPGIASAPAISEYVIHHLLDQQITLRQKKIYYHRKKEIRLHDLSLEKKNEWIQKFPAYGHIICRCEQISEQEVINCIHRPCGAQSVKDVKRRVRAGMGKCQGGYCEVEVAKILARELHIPLSEVRYDEDAYYEENKG